MKIYFNLSFEAFTNSYVIVNDNPDVMEAIIIDPGKITPQIIEQIENGGYTLTGIFITHNHESHVHGVSTLLKIYTPKIYAADYEVCGFKTYVINGDGKINVAGLDIEYYSVAGHTADSMVFKIGNTIFTGDTILGGMIGDTSGKYFKSFLKSNIEKKIFSQTDDLVLMPGHGPPSTIRSEKNYNLDISF